MKNITTDFSIPSLGSIGEGNDISFKILRTPIILNKFRKEGVGHSYRLEFKKSSQHILGVSV